MDKQSACERPERAPMVRRIAIVVALLACGACTSVPNFLRPPTPRAAVVMGAQAMHAGQATDAGQAPRRTPI